MAQQHLFEDYFDIKELDPGGKAFEKVTRFRAESQSYEAQLTLDINSEIYPVALRERYLVVLTKTLSLEGTPDPESFDQSNKRTLANEFDYVMHGIVYKFDEDTEDNKVLVFVSFGGLLMCLKGDPRHVHGIEVGAKLYLLMRRERSTN